MPFIGITPKLLEEAKIEDLEDIFTYLSILYENGSDDAREIVGVGRWLIKELRSRNIKFPYNRFVSAVDNVPIELISDVVEQPALIKVEKEYESFNKIYPNNASLPDSVKNVLPSEAQSIFRNVVNSQLNRGLSEERAFKSGWGALKNQGWVKGEDKWLKKGWGSEKDIQFSISKTEPDKKRIFGWAYVSHKDGEQIVDHSGEVISEGELEEAFYKFVQNSRKAGEMHISKDAGKLIEMIVFTKEKQEALGIDLGKIGAWVGFQLNDEVYEKVKSGDYKMLSIGGRGRKEDI